MIINFLNFALNKRLFILHLNSIISDGKNNEQDNYRNEIYSKSVRAGKRTYFFDVKATIW